MKRRQRKKRKAKWVEVRAKKYYRKDYGNLQFIECPHCNSENSISIASEDNYYIKCDSCGKQISLYGFQRVRANY